MGKKRKPELDLEHEQNMHGSFVAAANSLSQLYTKAVQQHKRAHTSGARHVLVSRASNCTSVRSHYVLALTTRFPSHRSGKYSGSCETMPPTHWTVYQSVCF